MVCTRQDALRFACGVGGQPGNKEADAFPLTPGVRSGKENRKVSADTCMNDHLRINIRETLLFFDEAPADSRKHATAMVAVFGEDLGASLLCRHMEERGDSARVITHGGTPLQPTNGTGSGDRLDRWLLVENAGGRTLYQVEVKNWSAHAIGGRVLPIQADQRLLREYRLERWQREWDADRDTFRHPAVAKVFARMKPPKHMDAEEVQPLVCYWWSIHPSGADQPLFWHPLRREVNGFTGAWVFSMSSYLRSLKTPEIVLEMPSASHRIRWPCRMIASIDNGI